MGSFGQTSLNQKSDASVLSRKELYFRMSFHCNNFLMDKPYVEMGFLYRCTYCKILQEFEITVMTHHL
jgi:hypothetical protein